MCEIFRTFRFSRFFYVSFCKSSMFRFAGFTLTLPHTPLRILKHRTKNTYELPKERITKRTNHKKNDPKNEPKSTNPKARTTKSTTEKHEPQSTSPKHEPSPVVCKPASQSHKVQQAPLIASLRPRTQSSPYRSHVS